MTLASLGAGSTALGALGAFVAFVAVVDLFLTVFNYDGYSFIASRYQKALWKVLRALTAWLPDRARHAALSVGSAGLLPATVALWLGLETVGFALMFYPGIVDGSFKLTGVSASLGSALYLSGGAISSLTFGDLVARSALDRALVDLETIVGLATFTLALGYVVTAFDVLGKLENLHGRVRRHAEEPQRPSSILTRHFRGGEPSDLPSFLQSLGEDLEDYDQGLRRYPVVFYFHTRRNHRSIPYVFSTLGELLALIRFGLPPDEPITQDPFLAALVDGYVATLDRLRANFAGPDPIELPEPVSRDRFDAAYLGGAAEPTVEAFRALERRASESSGRTPDGVDLTAVYEQYAEWLPFAHRQRLILDRVADTLGYSHPPSHSRV